MTKNNMKWSSLPITSGLSKPYPSMSSLKIFKHYPNCKNEILDLCHIIDKTLFTNSPREWSKYYVKPSKEDIQHFIENQRRDGFEAVEQDLVINETTGEVLENFIHSAKLRGQETQTLSYIVGPPGCGKSTLIKYSMRVHSDLYYEHKLIPMRLSLNTLQAELTSGFEFKHIQTREISRDFNKLVFECIARDWILYLRNKNLLHVNYLDEHILPMLNHYNEANMRIDFKRLCEDKEIKHTDLSRLTDPLKVALVYDMYHSGFTPLVMIDGFDYIGAYKKQKRAISKKVIEYVQDLEQCFKQLQRYLLSKFHPHNLILSTENKNNLRISFAHIIRNETYATYNSTETLEKVLGEKKLWFVAPPNQGRLIRSRISRCNNGTDVPIAKELLDTISTLVRKALTCHVPNTSNTKPLKHYLAISNYNCRSYLIYTHSLFKRTLYEATLEDFGYDKKEIKTFEQLITFIHEVLPHIIKTKPYILKECLILGETNYFKNHYLIDTDLIRDLRNSLTAKWRARLEIEGEIDFETKQGICYLKEVNKYIKTTRALYVNPNRTGVIDNIFNYLELPSLTKNRIPPFLLQLHLLLCMSQYRRPLETIEILRHAENSGYQTIDEIDGLLLLNQMTHEGLLNKNRQRNNFSQYSISVKGNYLLHELSSDFSYVTILLEHVLLPDLLRDVINQFDERIVEIKAHHPEFPDYRFSQLLKSFFFVTLVMETNKILGYREHSDYFSRLKNEYKKNQRNILQFAATKLLYSSEMPMTVDDLKQLITEGIKTFKDVFNKIFKY